MAKTIVLSLGGSLIYPKDIDVEFLKKFKTTILEFTKKGYRFAIYCGGGKLARNVQRAASKLSKLSNEELDWLGIHATKLNAQLLKSVFKGESENFIIKNPIMKIPFHKKVLVAAGWMPGWSTDYDAVLLAKNLGVTQVINMSNISHVYDKDPKKFKTAKKLDKLTWTNFSKLVGKKWQAGMNAPFDPIAAKEAQKSKMKVYIIGKDLRNLKNLIKGKDFKGTVIQ
jgi:uridylate kinase